MSGSVEGLIGRKIGMTQVFAPDGAVVPVTVLKAGPCVVVGKKTQARDGYEAVQLGLVEKFSRHKLTKPRRGMFAKHDLPPLKTLREFKYAAAGADAAEVTVGDQVKVDMFNETVFVDVVGVGVAPSVTRNVAPSAIGTTMFVTGSLAVMIAVPGALARTLLLLSASTPVSTMLGSLEM